MALPRPALDAGIHRAAFDGPYDTVRERNPAHRGKMEM